MAARHVIMVGLRGRRIRPRPRQVLSLAQSQGFAASSSPGHEGVYDEVKGEDHSDAAGDPEHQGQGAIAGQLIDEPLGARP